MEKNEKQYENERPNIIGPVLLILFWVGIIIRCIWYVIRDL